MLDLLTERPYPASSMPPCPPQYPLDPGYSQITSLSGHGQEPDAFNSAPEMISTVVWPETWTVWTYLNLIFLTFHNLIAPLSVGIYVALLVGWCLLCYVDGPLPVRDTYRARFIEWYYGVSYGAAFRYFMYDNWIWLFLMMVVVPQVLGSIREGEIDTHREYGEHGLTRVVEVFRPS